MLCIVILAKGTLPVLRACTAFNLICWFTHSLGIIFCSLNVQNCTFLANIKYGSVCRTFTVPERCQNAINVQDIGAPMLVNSLSDCEAACDITANCNALMYVTNAPFDVTSLNCQLRNIDNMCEFPNDANFFNRGTMSLLKCGQGNSSDMSLEAGALTATKTSAGEF